MPPDHPEDLLATVNGPSVTVPPAFANIPSVTPIAIGLSVPVPSPLPTLPACLLANITPAPVDVCDAAYVGYPADAAPPHRQSFVMPLPQVEAHIVSSLWHSLRATTIIGIFWQLAFTALAVAPFCTNNLPTLTTRLLRALRNTLRCLGLLAQRRLSVTCNGWCNGFMSASAQKLLRGSRVMCSIVHGLATCSWKRLLHTALRAYATTRFSASNLLGVSRFALRSIGDSVYQSVYHSAAGLIPSVHRRCFSIVDRVFATARQLILGTSLLVFARVSDLGKMMVTALKAWASVSGVHNKLQQSTHTCPVPSR